jgi:hypothetical protein
MVRVPMNIEAESAAQPLSPEQARSMGLKLPSDI